VEDLKKLEEEEKNKKIMKPSALQKQTGWYLYTIGINWQLFVIKPLIAMLFNEYYTVMEGVYNRGSDSARDPTSEDENLRGFESYCLLTRFPEQVYKPCLHDEIPGGYPRLLRSEYAKTHRST
jgi:hypothetical protein